MLMDHADIECERIFGFTDGDGNAIDPDFSQIREVDPGKNIHQRCLAAAVLSQER